MNGTINGLNPENSDDDDDMRSDKNEEGRDIRAAKSTSPSTRAASSSRASSAAPDPPPSRPPSSASTHNNDDFDMGDEFDLDAMLAQEEEMMNARASSSTSHRPPTLSANQVKTKQGGASSGMDFSITEDEEALFEELCGDDPSMFDDPPNFSTPTGATSSESRPAGSSTFSTTQSRASSDLDDEWAILDEIEAEQLADAKRTTESTSAQTGRTSGSVGENVAQLLDARANDASGSAVPPASSGTVPSREEPELLSTTNAKTGYGDEDWDDMYVD